MNDLSDTPCKGILIGERTGSLIEEWYGTYAELRERFAFENSCGGYRLEVSTIDGEPICDLHA